MTRLRATTVTSSPGLTVTVIESVALRADRIGDARWMTGRVEPVAVIVEDPGRTRALDIDGQTIDLDRLSCILEACRSAERDIVGGARFDK